MRLTVHVKPNSSETRILSYDEEKKEMHVAVNEAPEKDKANIAVLKLLKKQFKKKVLLVSGRTNRDKVVEIAD